MTGGETIVEGRLYGLNLRSRFPLRNRLSLPTGTPDVDFRVRSPDSLYRPHSGEADYESPFRNLAGESVVRVHHTDRCDHLMFPDVAEFEVGEDSIVATLLDPDSEHMLEILLLSTVLTFYLERAGVPALHASAVGVEGRAAVFLSGKNAGKTCLALAFAAAGVPLLADDILALEVSGSEVLARPSHPNVRLWPVALNHFLPGRDDLPLVHPSFEKRRVPVGAGGIGRFRTDSAPAVRIYLPQRRPSVDPDHRIEITPIPPAEAALALIRHSFAAPMVEGLGWQPQRLALLAEIVRRVPVRTLSYPSGFDQLPRVRDALLADLHSG